MPRIVVFFLDNVKAYLADLVKLVGKMLNIYLLYIPNYYPDLTPFELVFRIIKYYLKNNNITTEV